MRPHLLLLRGCGFFCWKARQKRLMARRSRMADHARRGERRRSPSRTAIWNRTISLPSNLGDARKGVLEEASPEREGPFIKFVPPAAFALTGSATAPATTKGSSLVSASAADARPLPLLTAISTAPQTSSEYCGANLGIISVAESAAGHENSFMTSYSCHQHCPTRGGTDYTALVASPANALPAPQTPPSLNHVQTCTAASSCCHESAC